MLLLKVNKLSLYNPLEFLFGKRIWDKMLLCLFKEEHIVYLIWEGRQVCEKPL
jgi:hypothetical protein